MNKNLYARKKRQLQNLAETLQQELGSTPKELSQKAHLLIKKIKQLLIELSSTFGKYELNKMLGAVALLFGLSAFQEAKAQRFDAPVISPFGLGMVDSTSLPAIADLDGDGDLDILLGGYYGAFTYYKNNGTASAPAFGTAQSDPFGITIPSSITTYNATPAFADLDGDGDLDLLVGTNYGYNSEFLYYQNTGTATAPQFAAPQVNPFGITDPYVAGIPAFVDLDGDGDLDLMVGDYAGDLEYQENTGSATAPQFASPQTNPFGLTGNGTYVAAPAFADFDLDGDLDLLVGEYSGVLGYFENTGSATAPAFAAVQNNPFGLVSTYDFALPAAADMDGDGDVDLIVAEYSNELVYFQNRAINIGLAEKSLNTVRLYPNPTVDFIEVSSENNFNSYEIYNPSGILVQTGKYAGEQISVKELPVGFYSITLNSSKLAPVTLKFTKS